MRKKIYFKKAVTHICLVASISSCLLFASYNSLFAQEPQHSNKPPAHGNHWMAAAGKPISVSVGSMIFSQGGNAVDAASAMLAASATIWDTMGWGGETQALIHNPNTGEVHAINALGAAPSGATPEYFRNLNYITPPDYGPLAAVTPGTPGGLMVMLAEYGSMSLAQVLAPSIEMALGYPIEQIQAERIELDKQFLRIWPDTANIMLPNSNPANAREWAAPYPGQLFVQEDLHNTLSKLVEAEQTALANGASREEAIMAAYDRFYRGDIAEEIVRASRSSGGLFTMEDLDSWQVYIEEPVSTTYKDIEVFKLDSWSQGPVMLQMLNMLEGMDLQRMGYNSAEYIHTLYQVMNLTFADRDFYYGDPYFPPEEPIAGLLSKDYARDRAALIDPGRNQPDIAPGNPYPYQGDEPNPFLRHLESWEPNIQPGWDIARNDANPEPLTQPIEISESDGNGNVVSIMSHDEGFHAGTTSIQAADEEGWVVSITPSGAWMPAFVAGSTGMSLSQRMQSFELNEKRSPYNTLEPGKRPRATLTPSIALKDGEPYMAFSVQGGDGQEQWLLQFFLNIVEFGMDVQQATEAANFESYQLHSSFGDHYSQPGRIVLRTDMDTLVLRTLIRMGYELEFREKTSGPITAILFNLEYGTMTGGASDFGDDTALGF
ncbi:MAG: gamma-glutamyltransferase [Gammaproteobacteria bacterium]|jgi:gamma-glutamyltranspeptidase / glutathione hydrolase|nr:gamma-glutamyltransferase [Gammaproteobacteria bacterium]